MTADDDALVLRQGVGAVELERDAVSVAGPDAVTYLQGQLSQDVAALGVGDSAFSLLLQPQGKVEVFLRLTRTSEEEVVLDTDAGWGAAMVERLDRFKLRVRCDFEPLDWRFVAVRGPGSADLATEPLPAGLWRVVAETPGSPGFDLIGPGAEVPPGATRVSAAAYEAFRIEAGVPRMGAELDATTIPAATGVVERSVSFTKGCYTGQELVARVDSRGGNVPRRLLGVVTGAAAVPPPGASVTVDGRDVGRLTSVAESARRTVALAYVRREVMPPADVVLRWDSGEAPARVEALPLTP